MEKTEELKNTIISKSETSYKSDTTAFGDDLKLSQEQQVGIIQDIQSYVSEVESQRKEIGLEEEWKDNIRLQHQENPYRRQESRIGRIYIRQ